MVRPTARQGNHSLHYSDLHKKCVINRTLGHRLSRNLRRGMNPKSEAISVRTEMSMTRLQGVYEHPSTHKRLQKSGLWGWKMREDFWYSVGCGGSFADNGEVIFKALGHRIHPMEQALKLIGLSCFWHCARSSQIDILVVRSSSRRMILGRWVKVFSPWCGE